MGSGCQSDDADDVSLTVGFLCAPGQPFAHCRSTNTSIMGLWIIDGMRVLQTLTRQRDSRRTRDERLELSHSPLAALSQ
jgi:hypothetical protein